MVIEEIIEQTVENENDDDEIKVTNSNRTLKNQAMTNEKEINDLRREVAELRKW